MRSPLFTTRLKSRLGKATLALAAMLASASCSDDRSVQGLTPSGLLYVDIETDPRVTDASTGSSVETGFDAMPGDCALTLTSASTGQSHTWSEAALFEQGCRYVAGTYLVEASSGDAAGEGFDCPAFGGSATAVIGDGSTCRLTVPVKLANALVSLSQPVPAPGSGISSITPTLHSGAGVWHTWAHGERRLLCLEPSGLHMLLTATLEGGRGTLTWCAADIDNTLPGTLYNLGIDCANTPGGAPRVTVTGPGGELSAVTLDEAFLNSPAPTLTATWSSATTLYLPEGEAPAQPVKATVGTPGRLRWLSLSIDSPSLKARGVPSLTDLLAPTADQREALAGAGMAMDLGSDEGWIDLTGLVASLVSTGPGDSSSTFTLTACGTDGRCSQPLQLEVVTRRVPIEVLSVAPAMMGADRTCIEVRCSEPSFASHVQLQVAAPVTVDGTGPVEGQWVTAAGCEIEQAGPDTWRLWADVPQGSRPVDMRLLYCGQPREAFTVRRVQPPFNIEVDAYATRAAVRVVAADPSLSSAIASRLHVYINGQEMPLFLDIADRGIVTVVGLAPSTAYEFKATMMQGVASPVFCPAVNAVTEGTDQLPNADFEEREPGVVYNGLPQGGRYSQTVVPIFNWQHSLDLNLESPKGWATSNAKTFATGASNHNTWYMQPSVWLTRDPVVSQGFAAVVRSVAFDPRGEAIADYTQQSQPYLDYSPVTPRISYRAAGKLFLGQYAYNAHTGGESYSEGVSWHTRPMALNGYYRYQPCEGDRTDHGVVRVQVTGTQGGVPVDIASGELPLTLATDYTAFSVPLKYKYFGIKATGLRVMFASSGHTGTIEYETAHVATVPYAPAASSTGATLWVDNLTLSY